MGSPEGVETYSLYQQLQKLVQNKQRDPHFLSRNKYTLDCIAYERRVDKLCLKLTSTIPNIPPLYYVTSQDFNDLSKVEIAREALRQQTY